ncbi:hypothetical protein G7K_4558-t1 [Saitoella complicata NRRL Y-17804]|uniref:Uncharacterized protein n=1 Tax=Saitoella complicata (strain BCRC 22490 / CBS 7301 / JCM 7358 / NBRC 10748 / NRRL Y-17804) TaxID=698492 RepID=A0A0E9NKN6_SAICN|nr:hypothetical protein G7K_4558-t1 [Saitoella complicata NRRL Y-17804]
MPSFAARRDHVCVPEGPSTAAGGNLAQGKVKQRPPRNPNQYKLLGSGLRGSRNFASFLGPFDALRPC